MHRSLRYSTIVMSYSLLKWSYLAPAAGEPVVVLLELLKRQSRKGVTQHHKDNPSRYLEFRRRVSQTLIRVP